MMPKLQLAIKSSEKTKSLESFENSEPIDSSDVIKPQSSLMLSLVKATYSEDIKEGSHTWRRTWESIKLVRWLSRRSTEVFIGKTGTNMEIGVGDLNVTQKMTRPR